MWGAPIEHVELHNYNFISFGKSNFAGIETLVRSINISHNSLPALGDFSFFHMVSLQSLDLQYNQLRGLFPYKFPTRSATFVQADLRQQQRQAFLFQRNSLAAVNLCVDGRQVSSQQLMAAQSLLFDVQPCEIEVVAGAAAHQICRRVKSCPLVPFINITCPGAVNGGQQIPEHRWCDGVADCIDGADEGDCRWQVADATLVQGVTPCQLFLRCQTPETDAFFAITAGILYVETLAGKKFDENCDLASPVANIGMMRSEEIFAAAGSNPLWTYYDSGEFIEVYRRLWFDEKNTAAFMNITGFYLNRNQRINCLIRYDLQPPGATTVPTSTFPVTTTISANIGGSTQRQLPTSASIAIGVGVSVVFAALLALALWRRRAAASRPAAGKITMEGPKYPSVQMLADCVHQVRHSFVKIFLCLWIALFLLLSLDVLCLTNFISWPEI